MARLCLEFDLADEPSIELFGNYLVFKFLSLHDAMLYASKELKKLNFIAMTARFRFFKKTRSGTATFLYPGTKSFPVEYAKIKHF